MSRKYALLIGWTILPVSLSPRSLVDHRSSLHRHSYALTRTYSHPRFIAKVHMPLALASGSQKSMPFFNNTLKQHTLGDWMLAADGWERSRATEYASWCHPSTLYKRSIKTSAHGDASDDLLITTRTLRLDFGKQRIIVLRTAGL